jgi:hypothetical protein
MYTLSNFQSRLGRNLCGVFLASRHLGRELEAKYNTQLGIQSFLFLFLFSPQGDKKKGGDGEALL